MEAFIRESMNTGDLLVLLPDGRSVRTSASMLLASTSDAERLRGALRTHDGCGHLDILLEEEENGCTPEIVNVALSYMYTLEGDNEVARMLPDEVISLTKTLVALRAPAKVAYALSSDINRLHVTAWYRPPHMCLCDECHPPEMKACEPPLYEDLPECAFQRDIRETDHYRRLWYARSIRSGLADLDVGNDDGDVVDPWASLVHRVSAEVAGTYSPTSPAYSPS